MLQNDFFQFTPPGIEGDIATSTLTINAGHRIFAGHFPGQPVVPGVCMMQMVKEVLENILNTQTKLVKAGDMKFLAVIDPGENNIIELELKFTVEDKEIKVDAKLFKADTIFFKLKGVFTR